MRLAVETPLMIAWLAGAAGRQGLDATWIVKGTFDLEDGAPARFAAASIPPGGDVPYEGLEGSVRCPSDFAPHKPAAELLLVGAAHAPGGRPVAALKAAVALGSWRKQDRTRSVDLLGFASQLMFTTALLNYSTVLESGKDHDLEIRTSTNPTVYTGSQKAVLTGVKDGKATYSLERTGGLADMLGKSQDVVVDENGVQAVSIEGEKIEPAQTELPAQMTTGKTWTSKAKFTLKGQSFETDTVFKVVGPRKVKTKLGEFDSILVTSEGSNIVSGQKLMISAKAWYVKGMGEVRIEMTSKDEKGKEATVTVEAVK